MSRELLDSTSPPTASHRAVLISGGRVSCTFPLRIDRIPTSTGKYHLHLIRKSNPSARLCVCPAEQLTTPRMVQFASPRELPRVCRPVVGLMGSRSCARVAPRPRVPINPFVSLPRPESELHVASLISNPVEMVGRGNSERASSSDLGDDSPMVSPGASARDEGHSGLGLLSWRFIGSECLSLHCSFPGPLWGEWMINRQRTGR